MNDPSSNIPSSDDADSTQLMRFLFGMLGVGVLLPYSALISCDDFYMMLHSETHDIAGQLTALNISALLVTTLVLIPIDGATGTTRKGALYRLFTGFIVILMLLLLLAFGVLYPPVSLLVTVAFFFGMMDAIAQSGLYILAASNPSYTAATSIGSAATGMVVSLLRLWTRSLYYDSTSLQGLAQSCSLLYGIVAVMMVSCLGVAGIVARQEAVVATDVLVTEESTNGSPVGGAYSVGEDDGDEGVFCEKEESSSSSSAIMQSMEIATSTSQEDVDDDELSSTITKRWYHVITQHPRLVHYVVTLQDNTWKPTLSTFLNFFVTLSLFPGIVSSMQSTSLFGDWITVILIAVFNGADFLGRVIVGTKQVTHFLLHNHQDVSYRHENDEVLTNNRRVFFPNYHRIVWYQTWLRFAFFPLVFLCIYPSQEEPYIANDIVRSVMIFLMGLSNGFIVCANFVVVPEMAINNYPDAAQLLNLLALFGGLAAGSYFGLALDALLRSILS